MRRFYFPANPFSLVGLFAYNDNHTASPSHFHSKQPSYHSIADFLFIDPLLIFWLYSYRAIPYFVALSRQNSRDAIYTRIIFMMMANEDIPYFFHITP